MTSEMTPESENRSSLTIGIIRLTDSAPVIVALERNFFAAHGLDVKLSVEPSWANLADKMTFGQMDAAVMLPPLALAMALGLRGVATEVTVPMGISLNGNSFTVSQDIAAAVAFEGNITAIETGRRFAAWSRGQPRKPRLAVVHTFSTHNLLLRYWLAASGIDPDNDVEITILPPSETADALKNGEIDGFCAGAPWGAVATANNAGRTILSSSEIWQDHPEKCLAVGRFATREPKVLAALLQAMLDAARYCENPVNAQEIAEILGRTEYLDVDPKLIRLSLPAASVPEVDRSIFADRHASVPFRTHAAWFLGQMARWGYLAPNVDAPSVAETVYRPELLELLTSETATRGPERFFNDGEGC